MIATLELDDEPGPLRRAYVGPLVTALFLVAIASLLGHLGDFRESLNRFLFLALFLSGFAALLRRASTGISVSGWMSLFVVSVPLFPLVFYTRLLFSMFFPWCSLAQPRGLPANW